MLYEGTLGAAEEDKALEDIYNEVTAAEGKDAGEDAVRAGITAGCMASMQQYGGALWCKPFVDKAWPVIKDGMQWIGTAMGDAIFAIIPDAWKAKGAYCYFCDIDIKGAKPQLDALWANTVEGLEKAWHEARVEAGLPPQSIDIDAELRKRLWAEGKPSNPFVWVKETRQACQTTATGTKCFPQEYSVSRLRPDHKPWDVPSGSGFSWSDGTVYLSPERSPTFAGASGMPQQPDAGQIAEVNNWYLMMMQNLRFKPFAFVSAEIMRDMARGIEIEKAEADETSPLVTLGLLGAAGTAGYFAWKAGWFAKLWRMVT